MLTIGAGPYTALASAAAGQSGAARLLSIPRGDGMQTLWEIPRERFEALVPWTLSAGPAPLSLNDAMTAARAWLKERMPQAAEWPAIRMPLQPIGRSAFYGLVFAPETVATATIPPSASDPRTVTVVVLLDGSIVEPRVTGFTPSPAIASPIPGTQDVYEAGRGVVPPRPIERGPTPAYTDEAKRRRIQGTVVLTCVVEINGACTDVRIVKSLDAEFGLDDEALKTAQQWRFEPGTLGGKPVRVRVMLEFSFNLR
jgi:TonB family protein